MTNSTTDELPTQLHTLNAQIEQAVGNRIGDRQLSANEIAGYLALPFPHDGQIAAVIDALSTSRLAALREWCAARDQVIRALRRDGARPWQARVEAARGPIAWEAPELQRAFGQLCDPVDWDAATRILMLADSELVDPITGAWRFDQLTGNSGGVLYEALFTQFNDAQLARLECELRNEQADVRNPEVRAGFDLLLNFVNGARQYHADRPREDDDLPF